MRISIVGQHIELDLTLKNYTKEKISAVVNRYFERATAASICFSKDGRGFACSMVVHEGAGGHLAIKGEARSDDMHHAFDLALDKIEKRLLKHKEKLHERHYRDRMTGTGPTKYALDADDHHFWESGNAPLIISEHTNAIPGLTVAEAAMRMEAENSNAFLFYNSRDNRLNLLYLRPDRNISWLELESYREQTASA